MRVCRSNGRAARRAVRGLAAAACVALLPGVATADTYPKNPGVDVVHYTFRIEVNDDSDEIVGSTTVELRFVASGTGEVGLDLVGTTDDGRGMVVSAVRAGLPPAVPAVEVAFRHEGDRLLVELPREAAEDEIWQVTVDYRGVPATGLIIGDNKYGERCFFSDNWPNKARQWLPTVDHPYDKATSEMIVIAPAHYQVISNGLLVEETDLQGGLRRTHWRQSVPIATWLNAVGIARFAVQHLGTFRGGIYPAVPVQTWVYPRDRDTGFEVFAGPTMHALRYYSDVIGPYVYEKLANVQSNSVGGGMESATSIFYGDGSATAGGVRWRNVIIHEIAHQWWGNAVTEYDWDDVWLSEGFATYFTSLFIEHAYGRDAFHAQLDRSRESVYSFYAERPEYRIVHDNLDDMGQVTTGMQYQKGAWVLHMLREMIGDDAFWRGIRAYWSEHVNGSATTDDFRRAMERAGGRKLGWFLEQWLEQGGVPILDVSWTVEEETHELVVAIEQVQESETTFRLPTLGIVIRAEGAPEVLTVCPVFDRRSECRFNWPIRPDWSGPVTEIVLEPGRTHLVKAAEDADPARTEVATTPDTER